MDEPGYFERLSQRALTARQNAAAPARNGVGAGESRGTNWTAPPDRLVAHRYRLEKRIGRGRLGDIFEAVDEASRDLGADRRIAVQLIDEKIAGNPRIADDIARAFAVLRTSSHPNVVRILDFGMQGRAAHVVMDLLEGVSLRSVLEDAAPEPLGVDETLPVILAVGEALQYLHAKGLTHGDLRPESVFVTLQYGVKLLDLAPHLPSVAPFYVEDATKAPNAKNDPRDDVYGLASLTYELLSGRHPFNANTPLEAHRAGLVPRPLSCLNLRDWDAVARGLELERARRTPTVKQFLQELGLTGNERLRASTADVGAAAGAAREEPPRPAAVAPQPAPPPPATTPAAIVQGPFKGSAKASAHAAAAGATRAAPNWVLDDPPTISRGEYARQEQARRDHARLDRYFDEALHDEASARRWAFLRGALQGAFSLAVIAGIVAFAVINYDGLRTAATDTMTAIDDELGAPRSGVLPDREPRDSDAGRAAASGSDTDSATSRTEAGGGNEVYLAASPAAPAPANDRAERATADPAPAAQPQPGAPAPNAPQAERDDAGAVGAVAGEPAASDPRRRPEPQVISVVAPAVSGAPVPSGAPFEFARPVVAVSERETAVAVVINRTGDRSAPASLSWWVSADSATPDDDYPELGQRVEHFAADQDSLTVFIPLVRE
jgi:serine/threonine protein kinase